MTATARPDPALEWAQAWMADHPHAAAGDLWIAVEAVYGEDAAARVTPAVWRRVTPATLGTPDTTGPAQPDPQVVAWMRDYLRKRPTLTVANGIAVNPKATTMRAWVAAHGPGTLSSTGQSIRKLSDAYEAARQPLTVADIPAGQGPASLYIGPGRYGELAVMYRTGLDHDHVFMTEGPDDPSEARRAMWDHLAATLPHVTAEEAP